MNLVDCLRFLRVDENQKSVVVYSEAISQMQDGKIVVVYEKALPDHESKVEHAVKCSKKIDSSHLVLFLGGKVIKPHRLPLGATAIHLKTESTHLSSDTRHFLMTPNIENFNSLILLPQALLIQFLKECSYGEWKDFAATNLSVNFNGLRFQS